MPSLLVLSNFLGPGGKGALFDIPQVLLLPFLTTDDTHVDRPGTIIQTLPLPQDPVNEVLVEGLALGQQMGKGLCINPHVMSALTLSSVLILEYPVDVH